MLKERITYDDFDGNQVSEDLYFNLTKTELADNLKLKTRFELLEKTLVGEKRQLTEDEITEILELVKTLMRMSYGIRSDDGRRFIKGEQVWTEFTQTMAYDSFLFSLFENPEKAVNFMVGILPKDLREAAEQAAQAQIEPYNPPTDIPLPDAEYGIAPKKPQDMSREELLAEFERKSKEG